MSITTTTPHADRAEAARTIPLLMRLPDLRPAPPKAPEKAAEVKVPEPESVQRLAPPVSDGVPASEPPVAVTTIDPPAANMPDERVSLASRRQRGRQRAAEPAKPRSWWNSHAPVIAIGFVAALLLTIYIARTNREPPPGQTAADLEIPELEIDFGTPASGAYASDVPETSDELAESPPPGDAGKSPVLMSAKPPAPKVDLDRAAADPSAPVETSYDYPSTDPTSYLPGGRPSRAARAPEPSYPTTSAPASWR